MTKKIIALLFIVSVLLNQCKPAQETKTIWLTIFVHGIMNIQPHLTFSNILRFWNDTIEDSAYVHAINSLRSDPYFQQYHAMQGLGLQKIDTDVIQPGYASGALGCALNAIASYDPLSCNNQNYYYTFGWSGLLSSKVRYAEAELLYDAIIKELEQFANQGIYPNVRVIGYSHGGNLVINLGLIHNKKQNSTIHVDQLVLLGVPIIQENYAGITSNLFVNIYNFYSLYDRVQQVDCLSAGIFLSGRIFEHNGNFIVPPNMKQIEYRIKRIAYHKPGRKPPKMFHKRMIRNADPGHTELWSFGWVHNYRPYLPIHPLPAVALIPYIIAKIEHYMPAANKITVDIKPYQETITLLNQENYHSQRATFLSRDQFNNVRAIAEQFRPNNFTRKIFDKKTEQAIRLAQAT